MHYGNHLGMVINSSDPEYRGRVQIFVPHVMPTLYDGWNKEGEDIEISCVGSNIPQGLSPELHARLVKILPWAEAASPIVGSSSPGSFFSDLVQGVKSAAGAVTEAAQSLFVQTPTANPFTPSGVGGEDLANSAKSLVGTSTANLPGTDGGNLGCAAAVSLMFKNATGKDIIPGQTIVTGTTQLYSHMSKSSDYVEVPIDRMQPGDILVTARGSKAGHTGIYVGDGRIVSNSSSGFMGSERGTIQNNYNVDSWKSGVVSRNPGGSGVFRYVGLTSTSTDTPKPSTGEEQTSASGTSASPNPAANAQGTTSETAPTPQTTITADGQGISGTVSGTQTVSDGLAKLAADRQTSFAQELNDPAIMSRLTYLATKEVGTNEANQTAFMETVINRAQFSGKSISSIANSSYYAVGAGTLPVSQTTTNAVSKVMNGSNTTNLATDAGSNDYKNNNQVANKRIAEGVTGNWLSDGQIVGTDQGEFYYRSNSGKYKTTAGLAADKYAKENGIETGTATVNTYQAPLAVSPNVVNNTDSNGRTPVVNTNDMAKGLFAFPKPGAMVWVFFREGNPLFPVYFAASYSSAEWKSAYRGGSKSEYDDHETAGVDISTSVMNLNSGGMLAKNRLNLNDPLDNESVFSLYHGEGSNITFKNGCDFHYSKNNKRDEVESDRFVVTKGYKEQWVEGDESSNVRGNVIVKIGKIDQEAIDAMNELADFNKELSDTLKQNS